MTIHVDIFPGRDNLVRWQLTLDGEAWDLDTNLVTRVAIKAGSGVASSDSGSNIDWSGDVIEFKPGLLFPNISVGCHPGRLIVYTPIDPDGIVWNADIEFDVS
jgi:hypothetical protein